MPIINQIVKGGGTTPTGTKSITANGVYDVTDFASADVQVPTTAPAHYVEKIVDANGKLINASTFIDLTGVTDIGDYVLYMQYYQSVFPANYNIDFGSVTTISGQHACEKAFQRCSGPINVDLSSVLVINGTDACRNMFDRAKISSIDLSSLTTISGSNACTQMFSQAGLESINFSSLTTISSTACTGMFEACSSLKTVYLNSLTTITAQVAASWCEMFATCQNLQSITLGGLKSTTFANIKNQFQYLVSSGTGSRATGGCTIHFPANFDPTNPDKTFDITTLTGYPTFGGNANYIHLAFDLPATE